MNVMFRSVISSTRSSSIQAMPLLYGNVSIIRGSVIIQTQNAYISENVRVKATQFKFGGFVGYGSQYKVRY